VADLLYHRFTGLEDRQDGGAIGCDGHGGLAGTAGGRVKRSIDGLKRFVFCYPLGLPSWRLCLREQVEGVAVEARLL